MVDCAGVINARWIVTFVPIRSPSLSLTVNRLVARVAVTNPGR